MCRTTVRRMFQFRTRDIVLFLPSFVLSLVFLAALLLSSISFSFAQSSVNDYALELPLDQARLQAEAGDPSAQWRMGVRYKIGAEVEQSDEQAVYWHRKSAEQGFPLAQRFMAWSYGRGENGLPQDHRESMSWGLKAAKQGDAISQLIVAIGYANGLGVQKNDKEAVKWLRRSALQGQPTAQHQLAIMYLAGRGTPEDYVFAYAWMNLAAAQGREAARESRDLLRNEILTSEQLAEAQRLSRELQQQVLSRVREKESLW